LFFFVLHKNGNVQEQQQQKPKLAAMVTMIAKGGMRIGFVFSFPLSPLPFLPFLPMERLA